MRIQYFLSFLITLTAARPDNKKCMHVSNSALPAGVDASEIPIEVCPAGNTVVSFLSKPFRAIVDEWLGRHHLNAKERNEVMLKDPWSITNVPSYANYTPPNPDDDETGGWTVHIHGLLYKRRHMKPSHVDKLINRILIKASIKKEYFWRLWNDRLSSEEAAQARRQVKDLATNSIQGGAIQVKTPRLCDDSTVLSTLTTSEGAFDQWLFLPASCSQTLDDESADGTAYEVHTGIRSTDLSMKPLNVAGGRQNESLDTQKVFFVPPRGLSIISDVDDILRVAEVWNWKQAILDLFARPYTPWLNMNELYMNWSRDIPLGGGGYWNKGKWVPSPDRGDQTRDAVTNVHFHYATDAPEVNAGFYVAGTRKEFPDGSFDFRPMNFTRVKHITRARTDNIKRLLETYPERKFILVGDTTSSHSMKGFPKLALEHPDQIQCILMRDIQATEPADYMIPAMRHFQNVPKNKYLFFRTPAGSLTPTLANISTSHLASLAALDPQADFDGLWPPYAAELTEGCFPFWDAIPQSKWLDNKYGTGFLTDLKLAWYKAKCLFVPRWRRPNHQCPFDRRPGTQYWDGRVEPEHDS